MACAVDSATASSYKAQMLKNVSETSTASTSVPSPGAKALCNTMLSDGLPSTSGPARFSGQSTTRHTKYDGQATIVPTRQTTVGWALVLDLMGRNHGMGLASWNYCLLLAPLTNHPGMVDKSACRYV
jgi:hypothetical protein